MVKSCSIRRWADGRRAATCARLFDLDLEKERSRAARRSAFAASALPNGFYFDRFRHEFIAERLEIGDDLRASEIRRFGEAGKTKALFGLVHKHGAHEIISTNAGFKCNYAWLRCDLKNLLGLAHPQGTPTSCLISGKSETRANKIQINQGTSQLCVVDRQRRPHRGPC